MKYLIALIIGLFWAIILQTIEIDRLRNRVDTILECDKIQSEILKKHVDILSIHTDALTTLQTSASLLMDRALAE